MAKKNQKHKLVGLVSEVTGERLYYAKSTEGKKLRIRKFNKKTREHEFFTETKKNLGRNEVKKRK